MIRVQHQRLLLETAGMVSWEWDVPKGVIHYSHNVETIARGKRIHRYTSVARLMQQVHPEDREALALAIHLTADQGRPFECEYRVRMLDRAYHWIQAKGHVATKVCGKAVTLLGLSMDTTERKRAENLRETLISLVAELNVATTPLEAARVIFEAAGRLWDWDCGWLELCSANEDRTQPVIFYDLVKGQRQEVPPPPWPDRLTPTTRRVLARGAKLTLRRPPFKHAVRSVPFGDTSRASASLMHVPIRFQGRAVGVLSVQSYKPRAFGPADLGVLASLAEQCGGALERIRQTEARRENQALIEARLEQRVRERTGQLEAVNQALRRSERTARALLNIPMAVAFVLDRQGICLDASETFAKRFGRPVRDLIGRPIWEVLSAEAADRRRAALQTALEEKRVVRLEDERSGLWSDSIIAPVFDECGEAEMVAVVAVDITQRKRAEEDLRKAHADLELRVQERTRQLRLANAALRASEARFSSAFKHAPMLIVLADMESGRYVNVNDEFVRVSGFSREEAVGRTSAELGWVRPEVRQPHTHLLSRTGRLQGAEIPCRCKDGRELVCLCNAEVIEIDGVPHVLTLAQDITERKRAEEALREARDELESRVLGRTVELQTANAALRESEERLQRLSRRLVQSQEQERHHIARELHDQIGQSLTAVEINLQTALKSPEAEGNRLRLRESLHLVDELVQQTQNLSLSLRPALLDDLGLEPALRWLMEQHIARAGLVPSLAVEPLPGRLTPEIETACFRVAQEALTNVVRHAQARHVSVSVRVLDQRLHLTVRDNGRGFDVGAVRGSLGGIPMDLGLTGMRERATLAGGGLEIVSCTGQGTTVLGWFPARWRSPEPSIQSLQTA